MAYDGVLGQEEFLDGVKAKSSSLPHNPLCGQQAGTEWPSQFMEIWGRHSLWHETSLATWVGTVQRSGMSSR